MGGWFVLKSIAHGSKCPIELCLPIDAGQKFSRLMITCSEFPLHLRDAANEVIQIVPVFTCKRQACHLSRQSTSNMPIFYQRFPSRNFCDLTLSCCQSVYYNLVSGSKIHFREACLSGNRRTIAYSIAAPTVTCHQLNDIKLQQVKRVPDINVHGTYMGTTWVLSAPDGPHVGPMSLAIRG